MGQLHGRSMKNLVFYLCNSNNVFKLVISFNFSPANLKLLITFFVDKVFYEFAFLQLTSFLDWWHIFLVSVTYYYSFPEKRCDIVLLSSGAFTV